jgi:hypothetical protein
MGGESGVEMGKKRGRERKKMSRNRMERGGGEWRIEGKLRERKD